MSCLLMHGGRRKGLEMKVIRTLVAGFLASSALLVGGLSVAAVAAGSSGPVLTSASTVPCPSTTHYEYGSCQP